MCVCVCVQGDDERECECAGARACVVQGPGGGVCVGGWVCVCV